MKHKLHGTTPIEQKNCSSLRLNAANGQLGNVFADYLT